MKGAREPVRAYALEAVGPMRARFEVARARGFSRFVGRIDEAAALEQAVQGRGQVVAMVGEPGVGKSRLCSELLDRCRARGLAVQEAHYVAHGGMIPFLPVLEMLRGYFGITDQDGDQEARRKIAGSKASGRPASPKGPVPCPARSAGTVEP